MAATSTSSSSSGMLIQELFTEFHSRKLLLHSPLLDSPVASSSASSPSSSPSEPVDNSFDANVVMVLSVLLCALICSLGLNSIIRCALRCSSLVSSDQSNQQSSSSSSPSSSSSSSSARLANTGIKKKALKTFATMSYTSELELPGSYTECAICLSEFAQGEKVRVLPKCRHGFHVRCIDKWLTSHSSCPTCRHCLIDQTSQKNVSCSTHNNNNQQQASSTQETTTTTTTARIAPLEPEGFVRNF